MCLSFSCSKYPKTDYTYSRLSPHRRELAPGVVAMPNMSRRSLDHHHDRVNVMAQQAPHRESYIRTRYQAANYQSAAQRRRETCYDSQDETDEERRTTTTRWRFTEIRIVRWLTTIVTTIWLSSTSVFRRRNDATAAQHEQMYYTRATQSEQGNFNSERR